MHCSEQMNMPFVKKFRHTKVKLNVAETEHMQTAEQSPERINKLPRSLRKICHMNISNFSCRINSSATA